MEVESLPEFFLGQIEVDLQLLQRALKRSVDEAALLVHIILQKMASCPSPIR